MIDVLEVNCLTNEIIERKFKSEELLQHQLEQKLAEDQSILDSIFPSQQEIEQAEFELKTIILLQEVGLL